MTGRMSGKTVLISGATNGVGKAAARRLARQGAQVVIVGRNPEKTAQVAREIGAAPHLVADLNVMAEVRRVARQFWVQEGQLDVLLNNAGAIFNTRQETPDGTKMTWALNDLNYFLLTQEFLNLLKTTPNSRVVNVTSDTHRQARMRRDDPGFRRGYSGWQTYGQSKLAVTLFTRELSRHLAGTGVTAHSLFPGTILSGFGLNTKGVLGRVLAAVHGLLRPLPLFKTDEQGAQTSIYLASSPQPAGVSGRYFADKREAKSALQALDDGAAGRLWALSETYVQPPAPHVVAPNSSGIR